MDEQLSRRRLLASAAAIGTVGLAGCLGTREGEVPAPVVTNPRIDDGWRLVEEMSETVFSQDVGPVTVEAHARSVVYEYASVADALAEALDASGSPVLFFTVRIDLRPAVDGLPFGLGRTQLMEEIEPAAAEAFRQLLRDGGIENVQTVATSEIDIDAGHQATEFLFTGNFPVTGTMDLGAGLTGSIADEFEIESRLAIWHDGTDLLLAGGAYPTRPMDAVFENAIGDAPVALAELVGESHSTTLAQDPETYAAEIELLLRSVV